MRHPLFVLVCVCLIAFLPSCQTRHEHTEAYACPMKCEGDKTYAQAGTCPVCQMRLVPVSEIEKPLLADKPLDPSSTFNLTSKWVTQQEDTIQLAQLQGKPTLAVMIYTSCQAACPRLVADMRGIREKVGSADVQYLLISIDPGHDTPARLREFMQEQHLSGQEWILLQGQLDDVRELSNVLAVKYKRISPLDFAHTNMLSVLDQNGILVFQQEGLGMENSQIVAEIKKLSPP